MNGDFMNYRRFREQMIREAARRGIPLLGEFEITAHCNFNCEMCYVVDQQAEELSTETWLNIFKEAVEAGLMFALLTGGEIFQRKDFTTLYTALYDLGVKITLFTNGTLINEDILTVLKNRPPEFIAITLYGASDQTYQDITKNPKGFTQVKQAIKRIKEAELNLIVRTIPLKAIYQDLDALIDYVKSESLYLNYLRYIGPTRSLCTSALSMRLSPEELLLFEQRIQSAFGKESESTLTTSTKHATCAALRSAYFINFQGEMQPCALAYTPKQSILKRPLKETFEALSKQYRSLERYQGCLDCSYKDDCFQCYARRLLEDQAHACPSYLIEYAKRKGRGSDA